MFIKKINLGLLALALGAGLAFAGTGADKTAKAITYTYGRLSNGMWIALDPANYECGSASSTCKGNFSYQNPVQNATPDLGIVATGVYQLK